MVEMHSRARNESELEEWQILKALLNNDETK